MRAGSWSMTWRQSVLLTALSGALGTGLPRSAWALCAAPEQGLLWSYPTNGSVNVPVDADLFVNGELYGQPTLAGEPLQRIASGVYDLGALAPQTRYEVRWDDATITFTTGDTTAPSPREPNADVLVTRNPSAFAGCPLVPSQGCFDTGRHTSVRFDAGPALAWLLDVVSCDGRVRTMIWPTTCGAPVVESEDRIVCVSARSTSGASLSESTGVICSVPDVPPGTLPRNSSCQGASPPDNALTLVADDHVTLGTVSGPTVPSSTERSDNTSAIGGAPPESGGGCAIVTASKDRAAGGCAGSAATALAALLVLLRRRPRGQSVR